MTSPNQNVKPDSRLTPDEIEAIAELAATKAIERVYTEIGKSFVKKALWLIGAAVVAVLTVKTGLPLK